MVRTFIKRGRGGGAKAIYKIYKKKTDKLARKSVPYWRSKHGGPAYYGQGVVKGALIWNSDGCWRGGENLAGRGPGATEERGGGAQLGGTSSREQSLSLFPNFGSFLCL